MIYCTIDCDDILGELYILSVYETRLLVVTNAYTLIQVASTTYLREDVTTSTNNSFIYLFCFVLFCLLYVTRGTAFDKYNMISNDFIWPMIKCIHSNARCWFCTEYDSVFYWTILETVFKRYHILLQYNYIVENRYILPYDMTWRYSVLMVCARKTSRTTKHYAHRMSCQSFISCLFPVTISDLYHLNMFSIILNMKLWDIFYDFRCN